MKAFRITGQRSMQNKANIPKRYNAYGPINLEFAKTGTNTAFPEHTLL